MMQSKCDHAHRASKVSPQNCRGPHIVLWLLASIGTGGHVVRSPDPQVVHLRRRTGQHGRACPASKNLAWPPCWIALGLLSSWSSRLRLGVAASGLRAELVRVGGIRRTRAQTLESQVQLSWECLVPSNVCRSRREEWQSTFALRTEAQQTPIAHQHDGMQGPNRDLIHRGRIRQLHELRRGHDLVVRCIQTSGWPFAPSV
mmetsp:Transcript_53169/g.172941  ORF Transcript_53169/g.172941 Transcript_53169/m.172941 type:complete len:201 (-) Transcript_53169:1303-1905(-)